MARLRIKLSYSQTIALGFFAIVLLGGALLSLPVSSRSGEWTPFLDAVFTAVSASCVTGLIIFDTYTHWSVFGQTVIVLLIQVGGIGFMTVITLFAITFKRKIGLHDRQLLVQSAGLTRLGGAVALIKRITVMTFIFEGIGAVILAAEFCPRMGLAEGLYNAVFHSVSSFCNAGFDLMGKYGQFSSLTGYASNVPVNVTVASLIAVGGIGFFVWDDILQHRLKFVKYSLHSKLVLTVTGVLILLGWALFLLFESGGVMAGFTSGGKILASMFQSVSPRTAGFNTVDLNGLSEAGVLLTIVLMFIGGSPGSTAGGTKTTTLAVLVLNAVNSARKTRSITVFKRKLNDGAVKQAGAVFIIYIFVTITAAVALCALEPVSVKESLFEVVSAIATVGLTLGVTPSLGTASKIIIAFLMFAGRVGWITLLLAFIEKRSDPPLERPEEKILIG